MQQLLFVSFVSGHDKKTGNKTIHVQRTLSIYYGLAGYLLWASGTLGNPKNRPKSSFNVNESVMDSRHNDVVLIYTGSFKRSSYSRHRLLPTILQRPCNYASSVVCAKHGGVTWLREYWLSSSLCRPELIYYSLKYAGSRFKCKRITKNLE